ncbi:MAG TPA: DUF4136 domain-containing protein [Candidatus Krumholzibacteria bacterium]|nr:DUF4136 domain-containing protein [Candidatus Krumholzibacteria bacterium]
MRYSLALALVGIALLAGCSSYDIKYDYDLQDDFSRFKTYAWIERTISNASGSATAALQNNTLLDSRIRSAVDTQMAAKGFTLSQDSPDVLVVYYTGLANKIDVTDWGYTYAGSYWGGGLGRNVDVYQYTEGTLIIDLVDSETKKLAWRGSATGVVEQNRKPEQIEARINDVVGRIFQNYPPKK